MYTQKRTIKDIINYSIEIKCKERELQNIRLMKSMFCKILNGYNNLAYLRLTLKEIQISKQLFVFNVELGDEAFIPKHLNAKDLGQCYRFYNPVLSIIQEMCSDNKKNLYIERNTQLLRMAHEDMHYVKKFIKRFKQSHGDENVEDQVSIDDQ